MRQEDYLKATVGEPAYYKVCSAAFVCGTLNAFDAPNGLLVKPDFEGQSAAQGSRLRRHADRADAVDHLCRC